MHAGNPCPGPDGDGNCAESCNEAADNCTAADPNASACNDGVFCNGVEFCDPAQNACANGTPPDAASAFWLNRAGVEAARGNLPEVLSHGQAELPHQQQAVLRQLGGSGAAGGQTSAARQPSGRTPAIRMRLPSTMISRCSLRIPASSTFTTNPLSVSYTSVLGTQCARAEPSVTPEVERVTNWTDELILHMAQRNGN